MILCLNPGKSTEKRRILEECISSFDEKLAQSENSRADSDQLLRALKATLEEERHKHASAMNQLESSMVEFVREKFTHFTQ